jgi:hypothetical protein
VGRNQQAAEKAIASVAANARRRRSRAGDAISTPGSPTTTPSPCSASARGRSRGRRAASSAAAWTTCHSPSRSPPPAVARELGEPQLIADALTYLGGALIGWLDDLEGAREIASATILLGAVEAAIEQIGYAVDDDERRRLNGIADRARTTLGEAAFAKLLAEGRSLSVDEAAEHTLSASPGDRRAQ